MTVTPAPPSLRAPARVRTPREALGRGPGSRGGPGGVALAAVLLALTGVVALLVLRSGDFAVNARFENSGQLVEGGDVRIAGRKVGSIASITLTPNGQANVALKLGRDSPPIRRGARATIRAVGQAGVGNRFVELWPGPRAAPDLPDGAVLPTTQTTGIVDLDALLNTFDPATRRDLAAVIDAGSQIFAGSGAQSFNRMLAKLEPALRNTQGLMSQMADDDAALETLIHTAAEVATTLGTRSRDLEGAVVNSARTFTAIARERRALGNSIERAPAVLRQGRTTLRNLSSTVTSLRPTLRAVPPVGPPLRALLAETVPTLRRATPVVRAVRKQLPALSASLAGLRPLETAAIPALRSLAPAVEGARPILTALRFYGPDFIIGVTNGLAGILASNYNRAGHYGRLSFVENPQLLAAGFPAELLSSIPLGVLNTRKGLDAPCPGAGAPPAPDGSNPWVADPSLCDPADSIPASVNGP